MSTNIFSIQEASIKLLRIPKEFAKLFIHGTLEIEFYRPIGIDKQSPHDRDELYVVVSGTAEFLLKSELSKVGPHDVIFVPAGAEHRFINFSDDFSTWVVFYGPIGGESLKDPLSSEDLTKLKM